MKKVYLLGGLLLAGLTFTACSDDDNKNNVLDGNDVDPSQLVGIYDIVAVNTENPTDFNMDGTSHTNQMEETECYDTASITFTYEETFTYARHFLAVSEETAVSICDDLFITGTYERIAGGYTNGTFRLTYVNGSGDTRTMDFVKEGTTLRYINQYGPYPDRTSAGAASSTPGSIEYVFTKIQG